MTLMAEDFIFHIFSCLYENVYPLIGALVFYYLLTRFLLPKVEILKLEDFGYDELMDSGWKKYQFPFLRKTRKFGNVPPVYPNGWYCLAESSEIPIGQLKYVPALGENFVVFRGKSGQAYVLDAYCSHLGANLGAGGRILDECIECPFHAWRYRGVDGKCSFIPYTDKIPKSAEVKKWQSCEVNGSIFVWYHAEGEEPSYSLSNSLSDSFLINRGSIEFTIQTHIQDIHENGPDRQHIRYLHDTPGWLQKLGRKYFEHGRLHFVNLSNSSKIVWEPCEEHGKKHISHICVNVSFSLFGKMDFGRVGGVTSCIGPGLAEWNWKSETLNSSIHVITTVTPIEPLTMRIVNRIYCSPLYVPFAGYIRFIISRVFADDMKVWNHKTFADNPLLVQQEQKIAAFRKWFSQFYSDNSPTLDDLNKQNVDW